MILNLAGLAGCASFRDMHHEQQARQRADQRWQLLIRQDFDGAYAMHSPGWRALNPLAEWRSGFGRNLQWLDGDVVGIDVKSHANPFLLAETLNRSLGGLELFSKRYIAINDQAVSRFPDYLDILRRECSRLDVEFTSVSALRRKLKARA